MSRSYERLICGRCEIHLYRLDKGSALEIPVVRVTREDGLPVRVQEYLRERNRNHRGPGRFFFRDKIIWYGADTGGVETDDLIAGSQRAVESIGPKILNLLR